MDVGETVVETVVDVVEDVAEFVSALVAGDSAAIRKSYNLVSLNYDAANRCAANQSIPLFHSPWALCVDCFVNIDLFVDLSLTFGSFGTPKAFHAEAGNRKNRTHPHPHPPAPTASSLFVAAVAPARQDGAVALQCSTIRHATVQFPD